MRSNVRVTVVWVDQSNRPRDDDNVTHVTYDVKIPEEECFVQLKVKGKPITVVAPDKSFADHPKGGSMIPLVGGRSMTLVAGIACPSTSKICFMPMKHNSGRMALIKQNQRDFALV